MALRWVITAALLAAATLCVSAEEAVANASTYPRRLYAMGDVHGDFDSLLKGLRMAGLADAEGRWTGGAATLVQVGDLVDRGPDDKRVLDYLDALQAEAQAAGGKVVLLLGNHELLNLQQHFVYATADSDRPFGGRKQRSTDFRRPDGRYWQMLARRPVAHKEMGLLFVHAGLSPEFAKLGVAGLNAAVAAAIDRGDEQSPLLGVHGPLWTRTLVRYAIADRCGDVQKTLDLLSTADAELDFVGVDGPTTAMVVGHTPERGGDLGNYCDGRLIVTDIGMSRWMYGNRPAMLLAEQKAPGAAPELSELTLATAAAHEAAKAKEAEAAAQEAPAATGSKDATLEEALQDDPLLLQQMMDTLREANAPGAKRQAAGEGEPPAKRAKGAEPAEEVAVDEPVAPGDGDL